MPRPKRYSAATVIRAIHAARGIKAHAAALLGCTRQAVDGYIRADPDIRAAYDQTREALVDEAEARLIALVDRDEWPAVRFVPTTLARLPACSAAEIAAFQETLDLVHGPQEPADG